MARHPRCIVSYLCSMLVSDRDHYPMSLFVLLCCACNNKQPTWTTHASVSMVICPGKFGCAKTADDISERF